MTDAGRITAVRDFGFTPRQARFLVLVLEHAGVCLPPAFALRAARFGAAGRPARTFAGIAHGRQTHRLFDKIIAADFATTDPSAPGHAGRIYHLQYKPWYRLLGEPDHRFSARFTRTVTFAAGHYRFTVVTDDGSRLWIDNQLTLDAWHDQAPTSYTVDVDVDLSAGPHTLRYEYDEWIAGATAQLTWAPMLHVAASRRAPVTGRST
jgi:hypothetical protein